MMIRRSAPAALALAVLAAAALTPQAATAASGARVILSCDGADGPVDLRDCLPRSRLEISREGVKTAYTFEDLPTLGDPSKGVLTLTMPFNFSVKVQNTGNDVTLSLRVEAPDGGLVHDGKANQYGWVQFYHCGPQVNPTCRDYQTPAQ